jgi:proline iminopeptidase
MNMNKWVKRGLIAAAVVLVGAPAITTGGFLVWREFAQNAVERSQPVIDPVRGVNELKTLRIGGIEQWVQIRGVDRNNPVLLYLHGGPGTPMMPFAHRFQNEWEKHFVVVQWDQRGVGKTYVANPKYVPDPSVTFGVMERDALELVAALRREFGPRKIVLLGHSWGSMLGIALVQKHPELFSAYVGTGQVVSTRENERVGYAATLTEARRVGNKEAVAELEGIAPYPDPVTGTTDDNKLGVLRKWQERLRFSFRATDDLEGLMLQVGLRSPAYSLGDFGYFFADRPNPWPNLTRDVDQHDARRYGSTFQVPVFFFLGRHDWQTPSTLAARYFGEISAPHKEMVWFEASAHSPPAEEPSAFARVLIDRVRPLADDRNTVAPIAK